MNVDHQGGDHRPTPATAPTARPQKSSADGPADQGPADQGLSGELSVQDVELLGEARRIRGCAYAPYSGFGVGAALRCSDGRRFLGVNVENASFGLGICAERVALATAVTSGAGDVVAVAVVGPGTDPVAPCGACRQVLAELSRRDVVVIAGCADSDRWTRWTLEKLLPAAFDGATLRAASALLGAVGR